MKKEATTKHKGLKLKTSDQKKGNPKMQWAQIKDLRRKGGNLKTQGAQGKRPPIKKEATPKCKRLKFQASDEKRYNSKT
jgi:hypothetical protein